VKERARTVRDRGLLSSQDYKALVNGETVLDVSNADTMIENVIGVMGLRTTWYHSRWRSRRSWLR
jgi:hydroxymethylglutaryl-CoA reductase